MGGQQTFVCSESGAEQSCEWEVRDSNERELLESARAHLQRRHAANVAFDQIRVFLRPAIRGIGGI